MTEAIYRKGFTATTTFRALEKECEFDLSGLYNGRPESFEKWLNKHLKVKIKFDGRVFSYGAYRNDVHITGFDGTLPARRAIQVLEQLDYAGLLWDIEND